MADKILKQNKIPGCDRLTRPEEIAALSRYLRNIREIREEHTVLDETTLEMPGVTTGQFVDIKELPTGYDKLKVAEKVVGLPEDYVKLDKGDDKIALEDHVEGLEDNRKISLSNYIENLEDNRKPELSTFRDDLEDKRDIKLSDFRDDLEDNRTPELSNYREDLEDSRDIDLSNYKEGLEDKREIGLSDYKEGLVDDKEPELSNYREDLKDSRDIDLSNYKEKLTDDKEPELSNYREGLEDSRDIDLSNYKEGLFDDKEPELSNYRDNLVDDRKLELNKYKENIVDDRDLELNNKKSELAGYPKDVELSGYRENLGVTDKVDSLYDSAIGLYDDRIPELEDYRDDLYDPREPQLENFRDDLVDNRENQLEDYVDPIANSSELDKVDSLYDSALGLVDDRENRLEDFRDDLVDDRVPELEDFRDDLTDDRVPELEDFRDDLVDDREPELEDFIDNLEDDREPELENYVDPIAGEINEVVELSDALIERPDFVSPEARVDDEYDYFNNDIPYNEGDGINPLEMKAKAKFELHRELIDLPETSEGDARVDSDYNYYDPNGHNFNAEGPQPIDGYKDLINLPDSSESDARVDADYKYLNQYSQMTDDDLYNYLIDAIRRPDFVSPEARIDDEYDYFDNTIEYNEEDGTDPLEMKAKAKFKKHQTRLKPNASPDNGGYDPEDLSNWDQKLEALVSAYLSSDIISPRNAHRFQDELNRMITVLNHVTNEYEQIEIANQTSGGANGDGTARTDGKYDFLDNNSINQPTDEEVFKRHSQTQVKLGKPNQKLEDYNNSDINTRTELVDDNPIRDANRGPYNFIDLRDKDEKRYGYDKNELLEEQKVPKYILPEDTTRSLLTYIRSKAEEKVGEVSGSERRYQLEEALWTLVVTRRLQENLVGSYRSKLPGVLTKAGDRIDEEFYSGGEGLEGLQNDVLNLAVGLVTNDKPLPINRPLGITETLTGATIRKPTTGFRKANSRVEKKINEGNSGGAVRSFLDKLHLDKVNQWIENVSGSIQLYGNYPFAANYLMGTGIATTLSDLCDGKQISELNSLEDLIDTLKRSEYITTPSKFGTIERGSYGTQTLDNNSYWEVIMEPLCTADLNGGWSFLPAIQEINLLNYIEHGVKTAYNKWIPINGFELQKSKLTTKSVGLYDGEIIMPISAEFTNELRLSIVDDQYKSWRRYFQTCVDVSVYNSLAHNSKYYTEDIKTKPSPTFIDKSNICIALYKNIAFSIKIYILTPQFSTIKKYNLLCVLKDFAEEYSGDVDGGGIDLSVSFSIVGEMSQDFKNYNEEKTPTNNDNNFMLDLDMPFLKKYLGSTKNYSLKDWKDSINRIATIPRR